MVAVGERFIMQQIDRQAVVNPDDKTRQDVDINALVVILRMMGFYCSAADTSELRTWLLDNDCLSAGPDFIEQHMVFVDRARLINALKRYKKDIYKKPKKPEYDPYVGAILDQD